MIRQLYIMAVLALGMGSVACHSGTQSAAKQVGNQLSAQKKNPARIDFPEEIHNFGTLKAGETVAYSFQFKNIGDLPFHFTKVETSCGCVEVKYSPEPVEGLTSSSIEVVFHSAGEWGNQIKTVSLETSTGESKVLTIGAFVENKDFSIDLNNLK